MTPVERKHKTPGDAHAIEVKTLKELRKLTGFTEKRHWKKIQQQIRNQGVRVYYVNGVPVGFQVGEKSFGTRSDKARVFTPTEGSQQSKIREFTLPDKQVKQAGHKPHNKGPHMGSNASHSSTARAALRQLAKRWNK